MRRKLEDMTAVELAGAIRAGTVTAVDAVQGVLHSIEEKEDLLHCYVTLDAEAALRQAEQVQRRIEAGELTGALAGVPIAVKDNLCTKGMRTTCSSKILGGYIPPFSAEAVLNLQRAGAVILGKTNMDEFGMGSTTETSAWGVTRNPWNTEYAPGGSSGGSAASVAAGESFLAIGTDTGGSVRQPASHCGVVGMKPTYGTVSRYGLIAYGSSLDQIGALTKDVTDCAAALEVLASHDAKDATSLDRRDTDFMTALQGHVKGMRIGIPEEYLGDGTDQEVREAILTAAAELEKQGALVSRFHLQMTEYAVPAYYTIASAEAGSNLERYDGIKYGYRAQEYDGLDHLYRKTRAEGFGEEVKRRIMLGSFVLSAGHYDAYYLKALRVKTLIQKAFEKAFEEYDVILGPTAPSTAPRLGESLQDPMKMYLSDLYTVAANLAGLPAISVPCGMDRQGLPIGMQLTGAPFMEKKLIQTAYAYEQARGKRGADEQTI